MKVSYDEYIKECFDICYKYIKNNKNLFITGRNMSGKSDILKFILNSNLKNELYFIDTINRTILQKKKLEILFSLNESIGTPEEILKVRTLEENFNTIDCFGSGEKNLGNTYAYFLFEDLYSNIDFKKSLEEFFKDLNLSIIKEEEGIKFLIENQKVKLSSGYQALLRIFIEIYYFYHKFNIRKFVIDEIDSHLDTVMCREIIQKLKNLFPGILFLSTVHSINFFQENLQDDILVLKGLNKTYKIINSSELGSLEQTIQVLFEEDKEDDFRIAMEKQILSSLKNKKFLNKIERTFLVKNYSKDNEFFELIKGHSYFITYETLKDKVFNNLPLTEIEKEFIKNNSDDDLSPDELEIKNTLVFLGVIDE